LQEYITDFHQDN